MESTRSCWASSAVSATQVAESDRVAVTMAQSSLRVLARQMPSPLDAYTRLRRLRSAPSECVNPRETPRAVAFARSSGVFDELPTKLFPDLIEGPADGTGRVEVLRHAGRLILGIGGEPQQQRPGGAGAALVPAVPVHAARPFGDVGEHACGKRAPARRERAARRGRAALPALPSEPGPCLQRKSPSPDNTGRTTSSRARKIRDDMPTVRGSQRNLPRAIVGSRGRRGALPATRIPVVLSFLRNLLCLSMRQTGRLVGKATVGCLRRAW